MAKRVKKGLKGYVTVHKPESLASVFIFKSVLKTGVIDLKTWSMINVKELFRGEK